MWLICWSLGLLRVFLSRCLLLSWHVIFPGFTAKLLEIRAHILRVFLLPITVYEGSRFELEIVTTFAFAIQCTA